YVHHPQDVSAASGMYAGGDLLLELMILCFLLMPTGLLVFFLRRSEPANTAYAKMLLGLSVTSPLSLGLMFVPMLNRGYLGEAIFFRMCAIPIFAVVFLLSLSSTQFSRARRLITYALLIEGIPFAIAIGFLLFSPSAHRG